jgi:hypothetical protein
MDRVSALQAEIKELKEMISANATYQKKKGPANPDLKCSNSNCNGVGHTIENCFKMGGGKQGQYPSWWKGKRDAPLPSANNATTTRFFAGHTEIIALNVDTIKELTNPNSPNRILADTGASHHFFHNRNSFTSYTPQDGIVGSSSRKGTSFSIHGRGNVEIRTKYYGKEHIITFPNTYHSPDISSDLISIGTLDKLGYKFTIGSGILRFITKDDKVMLEAKLTNGLYVVQGNALSPMPPNINPTAHTTTLDALDKLWHRRGGHRQAQRIVDAAKLLDGLPIKPHRSSIAGTCEFCLLANSRKEPYPDSSEIITEPLDLWEVNIWGPA